MYEQNMYEQNMYEQNIYEKNIEILNFSFKILNLELSARRFRFIRSSVVLTDCLAHILHE